MLQVKLLDRVICYLFYKLFFSVSKVVFCSRYTIFVLATFVKPFNVLCSHGVPTRSILLSLYKRKQIDQISFCLCKKHVWGVN